MKGHRVVALDVAVWLAEQDFVVAATLIWARRLLFVHCLRVHLVCDAPLHYFQAPAEQ
jgi:hypothetical protein